MTSPTTIQLTSKGIKASLALSIILIVAGFVICANSDSIAVQCIAGMMLAIGTIWHIGARIARWWNHA